MRPINLLKSIVLVVVLLIVSSTFVDGWLVHPENGGVGLISAVAIPVNGLNNRRIYMAFNFEVHFGLATRSNFKDLLFWQKFLMGKKKRAIDTKALAGERDVFVRKDEGYTRKHFYRILEDHITKAGYNGTGCLLRAICETSQNPYYEYNGVLGNIVHILFTPSSSKKERIAKFYSEAEINGRNSQCAQYDKFCGTSFLDLVSKLITVNFSERKL